MDYPQGASADATGQLTHDIEGRPLTAPLVAGRTTLGGVDETVGTMAQLDALAAQGTGQAAAYRPAREMAGDFGRTLIDQVTGRPTAIDLRTNMRPDKVPMVYAHELGHVIDEFAGQIPTAGLSTELKAVYNTLNNPNRAAGGLEAAPWGKPMTPQGLGYRGDEIPREYIVEAIRAYMTDPNYLKTVAPKTAARIREAVNADPTLAKIIQFNLVPMGVGLGAAGASQSEE
jgi:hypothetical protein